MGPEIRDDDAAALGGLLPPLFRPGHLCFHRSQLHLGLFDDGGSTSYAEDRPRGETILQFRYLKARLARRDQC